MEQSYKEKYEQAIEKIKNLIDKDHNDINVDDILNVFPELAESEGEKIKKRITLCLEECVHSDVIRDYEKDECIAWLEKQGETPPILSNSSNIGKDEQEPEENKGNLGGISPNWSEEDEPQKELAKSYLAKFDEKFPILPTLKGMRLADYKNFLNKCQQIFGLRYWGIRPLQAKLFEKLSLLWAAWGAEHLQGLGQTDGDMDDEILWSEEDEKMLDSICISINDESIAQGLRSRGDSYSIEDLTTICSKQINWLKSLKDRVQPQPKQEWTEEEIEPIISDYLCGREHYGGMIGRLCHLKPKQKQTEWSEDDKAFLDDILCKLEHDLILNKDEKDWLKSLRPQNRWKPSDEQIAQLQIVIDTYGNESIYDPILTELLFQLKKLKGEV